MCLRLVPWCYAARSLIRSSQMCWLSISWLLLQPGRTDLALWRSWLEWNIMDAKRRWYLLHSSLANINDDSPLPSLQARQRFWQRSCKVRVELVEMTAGEDFLIKLLQRLQLWKCSNVVIFCNTAETGVLWRAEQWLERLCSSRCRHGIFTAWWHRHICSAHEVAIGQAWCDVLHAAGSLGVCKSDRNIEGWSRWFIWGLQSWGF